MTSVTCAKIEKDNLRIWRHYCQCPNVLVEHGFAILLSKSDALCIADAEHSLERALDWKALSLKA